MNANIIFKTVCNGHMITGMRPYTSQMRFGTKEVACLTWPRFMIVTATPLNGVLTARRMRFITHECAW